MHFSIATIAALMAVVSGLPAPKGNLKAIDARDGHNLRVRQSSAILDAIAKAAGGLVDTVGDDVSGLLKSRGLVDDLGNIISDAAETVDGVADTLGDGQGLLKFRGLVDELGNIIGDVAESVGNTADTLGDGQGLLKSRGLVDELGNIIGDVAESVGNTADTLGDGQGLLK